MPAHDHKQSKLGNTQEKFYAQSSGGSQQRGKEKYVPYASTRMTLPNNMFYRDRSNVPTSLPKNSTRELAEHLEMCAEGTSDPVEPTVSSVIEKSYAFWNKFPSENARLASLLKTDPSLQDRLQEAVGSVYPLLHHTTVTLLFNYIQHTRQHGTDVEKSLYRDMDVIKLVDRLIKNRPLAFLGKDDRYLLGEEHKFQSGSGDSFEKIGTSAEREPLVLKNFLSYDEIRMAALLSMSSWSVFINDGRRKNYGKADMVGTFQRYGVICGQVGCRFTRRGFMDFPDCMVTKDLNAPERGFGRSGRKESVNQVWGQYWGSRLPTYEEATEALRVQKPGVKGMSPEFIKLPEGEEDEAMFNVTVYKKRVMVTAEILLCEAATRAEKVKKKAYVHVVGLGLGVWRAFPQQDALYVEAWGEAIQNFKNKSNIGYVDFSYIDADEVHGCKNNEKFVNSNITIRISQRQLHEKVPNDYILVCNYAWDGNSLPGNEFWMEKMCSTGDSAAACSSGVAEIHNHYLNQLVSGGGLHVATAEGAVLHWRRWAKTLSCGAPVAVGGNRAAVGVQKTANVGSEGKSWGPQTAKTGSPDPKTRIDVDVVDASSAQEQAVKVEFEEKEPAKTIPHETILGLSIPNPAYEAYRARLAKAKKMANKLKKEKKTAAPSESAEKETDVTKKSPQNSKKKAGNTPEQDQSKQNAPDVKKNDKGGASSKNKGGSGSKKSNPPGKKSKNT